MTDYHLTFTLLSDATFGRGEGIAGLIDREVEHDRYGLPYLRGRTLKGLITEEADNILFALKQSGAKVDRWVTARRSLFGQPGSTTADRARLRFGPAELPEAVRDAVRRMHDEARDEASRRMVDADPDAKRRMLDAVMDANRRLVLESLTAVRRQTAIETDGVPAEGSLRAMRVILRCTPFEARLLSDGKLSEDEEGLLAASVLAFRRAGTGRNRGRGKLRADDLKGPDGQSLLSYAYDHFLNAAFDQAATKEPAP